ncbi:MAG TPA: hypothetical protein VF487_13505 [Chitinophagaceae bacterium]
MKTKSKNRRSIAASSKKKRAKNIIIASVAVSAAGILGYFGWQYFKKKKEQKKNGDIDKLLLPTTSPAISAYPSIDPVSVQSKTKTAVPKISTSPYTTNPAIASTSSSSSSFPLKKGSKGEYVRLLQQTLIAKYGKTILPRYGADGDFGSETAAALKKIGLPEQISESMFNVLTQAQKPDGAAIGKELYNAASAKNYSKVLSLLKQMQTVDDYTKANEVFKQYRLGTVRQTIVNGLLNVFTSTTQKEAIRLEFLRIGLQYDGDKWSLSGFDGRPIVTKETTTVWINATDGVNVPARMVLGNEVSRRLDYTLFENNGKYFLVYTKSVQYLN